MLVPKKVKHRKWSKGRSRNRKVETRGVSLSYGQYGLKAMTGARLNSRQIEAGRKTITNFLKRGADFGSGCSPTNQSRSRRRKRRSAAARARWIIMSSSSVPAASFSRLTAFPRRPRRRRSGWLRSKCRFGVRSYQNRILP